MKSELPFVSKFLNPPFRGFIQKTPTKNPHLPPIELQVKKPVVRPHRKTSPPEQDIPLSPTTKLEEAQNSHVSDIEVEVLNIEEVQNSHVSDIEVEVPTALEEWSPQWVQYWHNRIMLTSTKAYDAVGMAAIDRLYFGRKLIEKKAEMDHGDWEPHLIINFPGISHRTLTRYMSDARKLLDIKNGKPQELFYKQSKMIAASLAEELPVSSGDGDGESPTGDVDATAKPKAAPKPQANTIARDLKLRLTGTKTFAVVGEELGMSPADVKLKAEELVNDWYHTAQEEKQNVIA